MFRKRQPLLKDWYGSPSGVPARRITSKIPIRAAAANRMAKPMYFPPMRSIKRPPASDRTTVTVSVSVCLREMYRPLLFSSINPSIHWFSTTVVWA